MGFFYMNSEMFCNTIQWFKLFCTFKNDAMLSISILKNIVNIICTIMKAFSQNDWTLFPILKCDVL